MVKESAIFERCRLLLGENAMKAISEAKVIVFGVGGVGSWCAESLVRTGVKHITIVDNDKVSVSNINRQLMATTPNIGRVKVEAMKEHLLEINPYANIKTMDEVFSEETAGHFQLEEYDYIIDAIDSLKDKVSLITIATRTKSKFFSSMGAALKMDPTRIRVGEFWEVKGCPLARALRNKFKRQQFYPAKKFKCVYSDELLENSGYEDYGKKIGIYVNNSDIKNEREEARAGSTFKAQINGSLMPVTSIFGITLGGLVIEDIVKKAKK